MKLFLTVALLEAILTASVCGTDEQEPRPFPGAANLRRRTAEVPPPEADDSQFELIAEALGVDIPTAKNHISIQSSFSDLVKKLEQHVDYAESAMAFNPGDDVEIFFKNKVPDEFLQDIEDFENKTNVVVQKKTAKKSRKEQENVLKKATKALTKKGFSQVGYVMDAENLQLAAVIPKNNTQDDMSKDKEMSYEKLVKKAKKILGKDLTANELDGLLLFLSSKPMDELHHTQGGRSIYYPGDCTTGFTVKSLSNGALGIASAGHCGTKTKYDVEYPEIDYPVNIQTTSIGYWGDFAWYKTTHNYYYPAFYHKPGETWRVEGVAGPLLKNYVVCGYSRMTSVEFCSRVEKPNVGFGGRSNLVAMSGHKMVKGDSGGPWFFGSTACGIHTGSMSVR
jgi:hypothetical protein